jgi:hypothetical protein
MEREMELLDRLREQAEWHNDGHGPLHKEAVAEIERLRAALKTIALHSNLHSDFPHSMKNIQEFAAQCLLEQKGNAG